MTPGNRQETAVVPMLETRHDRGLRVPDLWFPGRGLDVHQALPASVTIGSRPTSGVAGGSTGPVANSAGSSAVGVGQSRFQPRSQLDRFACNGRENPQVPSDVCQVRGERCRPPPVPPIVSPSMAHQSLYRRYRPRRFAELRGQDHIREGGVPPAIRRHAGQDPGAALLIHEAASPVDRIHEHAKEGRAFARPRGRMTPSGLRPSASRTRGAMEATSVSNSSTSRSSPTRSTA